MQQALQIQRERQKQADAQWRRYQAEEREPKRREARQEAKERLRAIVNGWNRAFAVEAFVAELARRAATLDGEEREGLENRR